MNPIVPADKLADVWPQVSAWIGSAVGRNQGDENLLDVLIAVARGQYLLWFEPAKYAAVVQVVKFPRQTVATVVYCGGEDLSAMKAAFEFGQEWCRANGITVIRTYGRRGWRRVLGLEPRGVCLQRAIP